MGSVSSVSRVMTVRLVGHIRPDFLTLTDNQKSSLLVFRRGLPNSLSTKSEDVISMASEWKSISVPKVLSATILMSFSNQLRKYGSIDSCSGRCGTTAMMIFQSCNASALISKIAFLGRKISIFHGKTVKLSYMKMHLGIKRKNNCGTKVALQKLFNDS